VLLACQYVQIPQAVSALLASYHGDGGAAGRASSILMVPPRR
jgi:hypothetical protein